MFKGDHARGPRARDARVKGGGAAGGARAAAPGTGSTTLRDQVERVLDEYFATLDGELPCDLYDVVMREVEQPLLRGVLGYVGNNQSQAADVLGISRGTLRKKLKTHGIL